MTAVGRNNQKHRREKRDSAKLARSNFWSKESSRKSLEKVRRVLYQISSRSRYMRYLGNGEFSDWWKRRLKELEAKR